MKYLGRGVGVGGGGGFIPRGVYDAGTTYDLFDLVSYLGSSYVALGPTTGNLPTDTNFWIPGIVGDTGDTGPQGEDGLNGEDGVNGLIVASLPIVSLTAPGGTNPLDVTGTKTITSIYSVSSINTSVTVRMEGRLNSGPWINLDPLAVDTVITLSGEYGFTVPAVAVDECRFLWVSEEGGTTAVLAVGILAVSGGLESLTDSQKSTSGLSWRHTLDANPSVRPTGGALQVGDRIHVPLGSPKPGDYEWNGLYWLSPEISSLAHIQATQITSNSNLYFGTLSFPSFASGILFVGARIIYSADTVHDASNFWGFNVGMRSISGASGQGTQSSVNTIGDEVRTLVVENNSFASLPGPARIRLSATVTGTPGNLTNIHFTATYRYAR